MKRDMDLVRELLLKLEAEPLDGNFLDSVRDTKVWRTTKDRVKAAGGFTIEILGAVAKKVIDENLVKLVGATFGG